MLAAFAAQDATSRGRQYPEPAPANRSEYQRDRDRIIHSAAFRRLEYKTQVFINHEGDLFRTRLTHSIEVAQIARSIARALSLNEDLTEAIALAHDLGHTPFGHSGQDALNECLRDYGGFEHNLQSLRVVDVLEERYAEFPGLNLTFETREGILKHCSPKNARELGELGKRFLEKTQPSLEAQLVNIADEIAYNNHDVDDGLRSELLSVDQLKHVKLFAEQYDEVRRRYPAIAPRRAIYETVRRMISYVVTDLIDNSRRLIQQSGIKHIEDVRHHPGPLIAYTPEAGEKTRELKRFLRLHLYAHQRVTRMMGEAVKIVHELFEIFMRDPKLLPLQYQDKIREQPGLGEQARIVADYIAGMTDRYAMREHTRLLNPGA
ncbi:MAG: deoxyguanosinetriphosphate triphosphohydrolase [Sulfuricaulis sp.]|nr:deoxyguanosinetriphosphate triphosphohydrolase [Sulfuricaulis sp.]